MPTARRIVNFPLAFVLAALLAWTASSVAQTERNSKQTPLRVVVTIAPLEGLVKPLLPKAAELKVLMPPGRSEHGYEFTPSDLAAVARADVLVYVGLGLEPRIDAELKKRPVESRRVVCFAEAARIHAAPAGEKEGETHEHKDGEKHDGHDHHHHKGPDQHLWLDPILVMELLPKVSEAIEAAQKARGTLDAAESVRLANAMSETVRKVSEVDHAYRSRLNGLKGRAIVTHHNAFPRLAERYGLVVAESIREFEGSDPTPGEMAAVIDAIKKQSVKTVFVEPQFDKKVAERIAKQAKVRLGKLDPLGDGDWFKMMRANLDELVKGLE